MTVAELSEKMGANEFEQWREYYVKEPFGAWRDNWHMATLADLYMQVHSRKPSSKDDFMYRTTEENKERQTRATLSALAAMAKPKEIKDDG